MSPARLSAPMMARPEGARKIGCHIGADLDPVPHPCTTSPGPCRRPVLLKRFEVCSFAEHDRTGKKGYAEHECLISVTI